MKKQLSEMTLEELWELFPIILTEHQECWREWYFEEVERIKGVLAMSGLPGMRCIILGARR